MKKIAVALLLGACAAHAQASSGRLYRSAEIPTRPYAESHERVEPRLPAAVVFELSGPPRVVDQRLVVLRGIVRNPLERDQLLVTFGGNEINPFSLKPLPDRQYEWSTKIPLFPPAPAIAVTQMIPAGSRVEYEAVFDLGRLEYHGSPTVRFEWNFGFYRQRAAQTGIVEVTLPAR